MVYCYDLAIAILYHTDLHVFMTCSLQFLVAPVGKTALPQSLVHDRTPLIYTNDNNIIFCCPICFFFLVFFFSFLFYIANVLEDYIRPS